MLTAQNLIDSSSHPSQTKTGRSVSTRSSVHQGVDDDIVHPWGKDILAVKDFVQATWSDAQVVEHINSEHERELEVWVGQEKILYIFDEGTLSSLWVLDAQDSSIYVVHTQRDVEGKPYITGIWGHLSRLGQYLDYPGEHHELHGRYAVLSNLNGGLSIDDLECSARKPLPAGMKFQAL